MASAKKEKYVNVPITYSDDDKLLETKLFIEIARQYRAVKNPSKKGRLTGLQKILAEKKRK